MKKLMSLFIIFYFFTCAYSEEINNVEVDDHIKGSYKINLIINEETDKVTPFPINCYVYIYEQLITISSKFYLPSELTYLIVKDFKVSEIINNFGNPIYEAIVETSESHTYYITIEEVHNNLLLIQFYIIEDDQYIKMYGIGCERE